MRQAVLLLSGLLSASAFLAPAPRSCGSRGRGLKMVFAEEAGVTAPLGYWDPLGLSADGDAAKFRKYRSMEVKHGRIAQLAALHYLVTFFVTLPGRLGDVEIADIPSGWGALKAVPQEGWAQIALFTAALEVLCPQKDDKLPGDVQPDTPLFKKLEDKSDAEALDLLNKELNNGRLAMIAVIGILVGNLLAGGYEHPFTTLLSKFD